MSEEGVLTVVAAITTSLLIISEILGLSKCKANAILELYKNFNCTQHSRESEVATHDVLDQATSQTTLSRT